MFKFFLKATHQHHIQFEKAVAKLFSKMKVIALFLFMAINVSDSAFIEGDILVRENTNQAFDPSVSHGVMLADPERMWSGGIVYYK